MNGAYSNAIDALLQLAFGGFGDPDVIRFLFFNETHNRFSLLQLPHQRD
jgi:hypothetical protein